MNTEIEIRDLALEIAGSYLADEGQCPGPEGLGHHTRAADCGKNTTCRACWREYLIEKAREIVTRAEITYKHSCFLHGDWEDDDPASECPDCMKRG